LSLVTNILIRCLRLETAREEDELKLPRDLEPRYKYQAPLQKHEKLILKNP